MAETVVWSRTKAIPSMASEVASTLARGGWEALLGRLGSGGASPGLAGSGLGSCLARLICWLGPRLLGQLGPAIQEVVPEAGDVLCVLSQRAI